MDRTAAIVRRRGLPKATTVEYQLFVSEVVAAFRSLEELASSSAAGKRRSAERFMHAARGFARGSWYAVVCLSFNALKLAVCTKSLGDVGGRSALPPRQLRRLVKHLGRLEDEHPRVAAALPDLFEDGLAETRLLVDDGFGKLRDEPSNKESGSFRDDDDVDGDLAKGFKKLRFDDDDRSPRRGR